MTNVLINGKKEVFSSESSKTLQDLLDDLQMSAFPQTEVISWIAVNGSVLTEKNRASFLEMPISKVLDLQVKTMNTVDLARETVEDLTSLVQELARFSGTLATYQPEEQGRQFVKLVDGIEAMTEAVVSIRGVLEVKPIPLIAELENQMADILGRILQARQSQSHDTVNSLLMKDLPQNLEEWHTKAFPALVRARDS
jgi:sulfur carrier protein ThiS